MTPTREKLPTLLQRNKKMESWNFQLTQRLFSFILNIVNNLSNVNRIERNRRPKQILHYPLWKEGKSHLPDSCLWTSLELRQPSEKMKYKEPSANTVAFISCRRSWKLLIFHLFTGFSLLQWCVQTWVR